MTISGCEWTGDEVYTLALRHSCHGLPSGVRVRACGPRCEQTIAVNLITTNWLLWLVCVVVWLQSVMNEKVECSFKTPSRLCYNCLFMIAFRSDMGYYLSRDCERTAKTPAVV